MLKQTQIYIGTDTGPTHLAALLKVPMMLFRCNLENLSPNTLTTSIIPIAKQEGFFAKLVEDGWDHPENVVREVSVYLQKN